MAAQDSIQSTITFDTMEHMMSIRRVWEPAGEPRAIMQIAHGMSEYIDRYDDFGRWLAAQGVLVCGADHYAHGVNVSNPDNWGVLPADKGTDILVEGFHLMRLSMEETYGTKLPYFVFGHSMGSFVVRAYIARHGQGLNGAIVCGTGHNPKAVCDFGGFLARRIAKSKGDAYRSKFLNGLADGAYAKAIPDARTPFDWLNTDPAKVDEYIADPACGFMFSAGGYSALMGLTSEVADKKKIAQIAKDLPVYFIAGEGDPVGNMGAGVRTVYEMFRAAGIQDVDCKIYTGMRHEILNEPGHLEVYEDVLAWLNAHTMREAAPAQEELDRWAAKAAAVAAATEAAAAQAAEAAAKAAAAADEALAAVGGGSATAKGGEA